MPVSQLQMFILLPARRIIQGMLASMHSEGGTAQRKWVRTGTHGLGNVSVLEWRASQTLVRGTQVHYELWHHSPRRPCATWLAVCPASDMDTAQARLDGIRIDGATPALPDHDACSGNGPPPMRAALPVSTRSTSTPGAPAARALLLEPSAVSGEAGDRRIQRGPSGGAWGVPNQALAAAPVRARPGRSVWAPMEYEAMPRWGIMDWARFLFYRRALMSHPG